MTTNDQTLLRAKRELNWARLCAITSDCVVQKLSDKDQGAQHMIMMNDLRQDHVVRLPFVEGVLSAANAVIALGLHRAPGSKNRHHNREGGLVEHLLEMWDIWQMYGKSIIRQFGQPHELITDANIWRTILYHDLNKVWRYTLISEDPWIVDYANALDRVTMLVGSHQKSLWFLNKYKIQITLPVYNALLCSEGGYNEQRPPIETVLAKIVYLLDDMSANVTDRLNTKRFWDSKTGGLSGMDTL